MPGARRLGSSLAASALLHALVLELLLRTAVAPVVPARVLIPVALVGRIGGGGGTPGTASTPAPAEAAAPAPPRRAEIAPPTPIPHPAPHREHRVLARAVPAPAPLPTAAERSPSDGLTGSGTGTGGGGGGGAGGDGSGGDGSGGRAAAYGANPLPAYPLIARRLGKEGVVVLEVLVASDGHPAEVRILRSSGFAPLDESAIATVRAHWRFVPARSAEGTPVESRVTVPIRFRLQDVQG
jgi:protein TonB